MLKGQAVSKGISIGKCYKYIPKVYEAAEAHVEKADVQAELEQFRLAVEAAVKELASLTLRVGMSDREKAKIFVAHKDILEDEAITEEIEESILYDMCKADYAVFSVYTKYASRLSRVKDILIQERVSDIYDVRSRLLRCLKGEDERSLSCLDEPVIIVAHDLFPSDTAALDRKNVLGIATEVGSSTSHSAIIARNYGIPAVLGVDMLLSGLEDGQEIILDAINGNIHCSVSESLRKDYLRMQSEYEQMRSDTEKYLAAQARFADGEKVEIELNIAKGSVEELDAAKYADGVGLFRTEFLYMGRPELPTEQEQFAAYRRVLEAFGEKPVILRTLDIGGDKNLDCMELPAEENPFLGNRALRLCLSHRDIFKTQLRAVLRASIYGNIKIMFPMVGALEELRQAKKILCECKDELRRESIPFKDVPVGIMIEIPSIAMIADKAASETDFCSIGTNDLTQYLMAADRINPSVSEYYRFYHPSIFRLIQYVHKSYSAFGKSVSVCGEMGGDEKAAAVLLGMGIRQISMGVSCVAGIKKMIVANSAANLAEMADKVINSCTEKEALENIESVLR